jgi:hypothetical protein
VRGRLVNRQFEKVRRDNVRIIRGFRSKQPGD